MFSDSVVRVRPYDTEYNDGSLFHEILDLIHVQIELANRGIFVRGGLTVGDMYQDRDILFGPAMVRAYDLETSFANYPRIVIDPEVFAAFVSDKRLRSDGHDLKQETKYVRSMLRQGDDGLYFIDFLGASRDEMDEPEGFPDLLAKMKSMIVGNANAGKGNLRIVQKYLWLARYLNIVASEYSDCAMDPKILITGKDIPELAVNS